MGATFSISKIPGMLSMGMRMLIVAIGAVMLMLLASFPSSLIGPEPTVSIPGVDYAFLVEWKNWLWLAPWLLMELAALIGPRRNFVWFCGLGGVIVLSMLAYPIIQAARPELVHPSFKEMVYNIFLTEELEQISILHEDSAYRDKCLAYGLPILWALLGLSLFLRTVVLGYMMRIHAKPEENEFNTVDAADIAPDAENARTVKEIAANPQKVQAKFKFGEADKGLVAHLRELLQRMRYLRTVRGLCWLGGACFVMLWFLLYPQPDEQQALERDLEAMYETTTDAEGNTVGTTRAVYAALRVMKYATEQRSIDNKTVKQAEQWLQLDRAPEEYRAAIRNEDIEELTLMPLRLKTSVPYSRFLSITDGRLHAVMMLNLRTNEIDSSTGAPLILPETKINFPQYFEFGWDTAEDKRRAHPYLEDEIYQFNNASFF